VLAGATLGPVCSDGPGPARRWTVRRHEAGTL